MRMTKRDELRLVLERECTQLIQSLAHEIDQANIEILYDFVQNYEYAVALDWLESLIAERSIPLTEQQESEMQRLKGRMNTSPLDETDEKTRAGE